MYYPREVRKQLHQFDAYNAVLEHGHVPKLLHHSEAAVPH
jgi:hypothetical protein